MSRQRSTIPTYQKHSSGRARVRTYDANGNRIEIVLPGEYGSAESKEAYEQVLAQLRTGAGQMPKHSTANALSVSELVLRFMEYAETYYVHPGTRERTSEVAAYREAVRPLVRLFGRINADDFDQLHLQTLRDAMITGSWLTEAECKNRRACRRPIGFARTTCNRHIGRIKSLFRWGASKKLVSASVYHALQTVAGLRRGRSAARETEPVKPISAAIIDDTLPYIPPIARDVVEILLLTGMRCGEAVIMRTCDLDMTGDIWLYRPERHKGLWRDKERVIAIGPRAQSLIGKYLTTEIDAYLFSPREQAEIINAEKRRNRKTPVQPSQIDRSKPNAARKPGEKFRVGGINKAIRYACARAGIKPWHTHQLRHSASLAFSREAGLEGARAALGHADVNMSAMYAGRDIEAAKEVAKRIG